MGKTQKPCSFTYTGNLLLREWINRKSRCHHQKAPEERRPSPAIPFGKHQRCHHRHEDLSVCAGRDHKMRELGVLANKSLNITLLYGKNQERALRQRKSPKSHCSRSPLKFSVLMSLTRRYLRSGSGHYSPLPRASCLPSDRRRRDRQRVENQTSFILLII